MYRFLWGASAFLLLLAIQPVDRAHAAGNGQTCQQKKKSPFGGLVGGIASSALGRAGVGNSVGGVWLPVNSMLTNGIVSLLDCKEQQQAAHATQEAVRGGNVGSSANWQSESRPNVSGSSTVTGKQARADGSTCLTVTDVVIVNGEETTVPKTMCRAPGASGYTLAA